MNVVTRFAPSPTGYLHLGGARTALFNFLYAKNRNGKFLLRIEDTDIVRSTSESVDSILQGLNWLGINPDEKPVFQLSRQSTHFKYAEQLLVKNLAYKCFCSKEELLERKNKALAGGAKYFVYDKKCRNINPLNYPKDKPYTIRLKIDEKQDIIIHDLILGKITVNTKEIEDFVILRSDNIPTYMFAVVIDDYEMNISHVIRGDDHLTNTFRQYCIYQAFGWKLPFFAHLPLIHSINGGKLSKRDGALAVIEYKEMGFLPQTVINYLLRLGWFYGEREIINLNEAIKLFDLSNISKASAKFDFSKLKSFNHNYIMLQENNDLLSLMLEHLVEDKITIKNYQKYILKSLDSIKKRSATILELVKNVQHFLYYPVDLISTELLEQLRENKENLLLQYQFLSLITPDGWFKNNLLETTKNYSEKSGIVLKKLANDMRICLTGFSIAAMSNFEIMEILGKDETLQRIDNMLNIL